MAKYQCVVYLMRLVPNIVAGETLNFGVILHDPASGIAESAFSHDYRRMTCFDPSIDLDLVKALETEIKNRLQDPADQTKFFEKVPDWSSNYLQLSIVGGVETDDIQAQLAVQANLYLKGRRRRAGYMQLPIADAVPASNERTRNPRSAVRDAFDIPDLRHFFKWNIPVSDYVLGDPLIIQCGYESNGSFKMFHGVSLRNSVDEEIGRASCRERV